jgi:hypothetical protein
VALVGIVVVDIVVPAKLLVPLVSATERMGEEADEAGAVRGLPSVMWPTAALVLGVLVMGLAAWRMIREQAVEGRWLWTLAVAAATILWSASVMAALYKAEKALASLAGGM